MASFWVGAVGGNEDRDPEQDRDDPNSGGEYRKVHDVDFEELRLNQPPANHSSDDAETETCGAKFEAITHDHLQDVASERTQCHADADLPLPLFDGVGHDAVDPEARKGEGRNAKQADQEHHRRVHR